MEKNVSTDMFSDSFDLSIIPETPVSRQTVVPETPYHPYPNNMVPESLPHPNFVPESICIEQI